MPMNVPGYMHEENQSIPADMYISETGTGTRALALTLTRAALQLVSVTRTSSHRYV